MGGNGGMYNKRYRSQVFRSNGRVNSSGLKSKSKKELRELKKYYQSQGPTERNLAGRAVAAINKYLKAKG